MIEWLKLHGINIIISIVLGLVVFIIINIIVPQIVQRTVKMGMRNKPDIEIKKRSRTLSQVIRNTAAVVIGLIVLFTVLAEVGMNIGPALAGLGIIGLAIGFGAQSMVKDIINGLFILIENPYSIGDIVRVAGISGLVEEVNLRRTIVRDLDGVVHYIPNGEINVASNFTKEFSRVNLNISVGYNEDLDKVIEEINRVCDEITADPAWQNKILKKPQVLRVDNLGDSGIDIKILGDTVPLEQWAVTGEIRKRIKAAFDQKGIKIPWPHMKVYFGNQLPKT
ncbi:hypothetical protein A2Y85_04875 [candidate division WOR-3 bacterium RBG_13_43_14]|uniref:Mechanosensitive ion channel family protein n=1 Tax=candidate division WOR-3 bacterium RBG_13_43_14 TaxID=1802590 RepID=A0A1F4U2Q1_UNCW3|nr:MAG: hypothetical protein A2Y85_04875 [candidate division WOR-3 bacterium RBG_13_43_14]